MQPDADRLPQIADRSVDLIISVATIEHVLDPYRVLDELHRIARDDATLVCSVPNYAYLKHRIRLLFGELPRTGTDEPVASWREAGWDGMHLHTFTQSAFATLLADCGWRPLEWTGWGDRFGWLRGLRQRFPGLLSGEIIACCVPPNQQPGRGSWSQRRHPAVRIEASPERSETRIGQVLLMRDPAGANLASPVATTA